MLLTLPHVLSAPQLAQVQSLLQEARWRDGAESAGSQAKWVKRNEQLGHDDPVAQAIRQMVLAGLQQHPLFFSAVLPLRTFTPRINRYSGSSNAYGPHFDNAVRLLQQSSQGQHSHPQDQYVRTDVSCTVFLNDPDDYDGGELCVHDTFGQHRVKLPAGHAVIYPGTSLHEVAPVTRGERLACFFWVESMVRSDEQRSQLYALDMAITALRQQGESEQTVQLTGVYHNLLRMWAST
jgi:PKHD-type hydroxylase